MMGNEQSTPANNPCPKGRIDFNLHAVPDACGSIVESSGYRTSVVDDGDLKAFRITPNKLKRAVSSYYGKAPTDAFVKSPTPWGDMYTRYKWEPVEKTVEVISAEVIDVESTTIGLATRRYINKSDVSGTFNTSFTETVTNTVSTTWSDEYSFNSGINYDLNFPGSVNLAFTGRCGLNLNRSKSVSIAAQSGVNVTLEPGRSVIVHLRTKRNKMYVKVNYEISLDGYVACNYDGSYKGHTFWAFDVNEILEAADKPTVIETSEVLELTYYTDGEIELDRINERCSSTDEYCMRHGVRDYNLRR